MCSFIPHSATSESQKQQSRRPFYRNRRQSTLQSVYDYTTHQTLSGNILYQKAVVIFLINLNIFSSAPERI